MGSAPTNQAVTFSQITKAEFLEHIYEHTSERRISNAEKSSLIEWLTNLDRRPNSQKEFSRRNYARRTFFWDESTQILFAKTKDGGEGRTVVTEETIADVVELVHNNNGHAGWDATWKDINTSYYGILRSDVTFLLKQCQICAGNPRKRSKRSLATSQDFQTGDQTVPTLDFDGLFSSLDRFEREGYTRD